MGKVIDLEKESYLGGVKFWAQWWVDGRVPAYEVFQYVGRRRDVGLYFFVGLRSKQVISQGIYQLNANGFKPFCISTDKLKEYEKEL